MRSAATFAVPKPDERTAALVRDDVRASMVTAYYAEVDQWVDRVNERAGRSIVMATGSGTVRHRASGRLVLPGKIILIVDGERTAPSVYYVLDRMEMLA